MFIITMFIITRSELASLAHSLRMRSITVNVMSTAIEHVHILADHVTSSIS